MQSDAKIIGFLPASQGTLLVQDDFMRFMPISSADNPPMFAPAMVMNNGKFKLLRAKYPSTVIRSGAGKCDINESSFKPKYIEKEVAHCPFDVLVEYCLEDFELECNNPNKPTPADWFFKGMDFLNSIYNAALGAIAIPQIQQAVANDFVRVAWGGSPSYPAGSPNLATTLAGAAKGSNTPLFVYDLEVLGAEKQQEVNSWLNGYINEKGRTVEGIFRCSGFWDKIKNEAVDLGDPALNLDTDLIRIDTNNGSDKGAYNQEAILQIMQAMHTSNPKMNDPNSPDAPFFVLPDSLFNVFLKAKAALGQGTDIPYNISDLGAPMLNRANYNMGWLNGFKVFRYKVWDELATEMGATTSVNFGTPQGIEKVNRNVPILFMRPQSLQPFYDTSTVQGTNNAGLVMYQKSGDLREVGSMQIGAKFQIAFDFMTPNHIVVGYASNTTTFV